VQEAQRAMDKVEVNRLQVRVELQADCLAGVWANHAEEKWRFIEAGDVESEMQTASARFHSCARKVARALISLRP
jgi:uncharacterized protein